MGLASVAGLAVLAVLTVPMVAGRPTSVAAAAVLRGSAPWPERILVRERLLAYSEVVTPTSLYALILRTHTPMRGPYRLKRTDLRTGSVRKGALFTVGRVAVASGYVWVYGTGLNTQDRRRA